MHLLTQAKSYELRVDMEDFEGQRVYAHYSSFSVGPETEGYKLTLGSFIRGAAGAMYFHSGISDYIVYNAIKMKNLLNSMLVFT